MVHKNFSKKSLVIELFYLDIREMGQGKSFAHLQSLREEIIELGIFLEAGDKKPNLNSNRCLLDFLWNTKNNAYSDRFLQNKENRGMVRYLRKICDEALRLRNSLSQLYMPLVYRQVHHYSHKNQDYLDLVQEGVKGLLRAIDTFDVTFGVPFEAYAVTWIRKYLSNIVTCNSEVVRIPESQMRIHRQKRDSSSISSYVDFLEDIGTVEDESLNTEQQFVMSNTMEYLKECVDLLNCKQRNVIRTRYYSGARKTVSLETAGKLCGYSRERTRQIEQEALNILEKKMEKSQRRQ